MDKQRRKRKCDNQADGSHQKKTMPLCGCCTGLADKDAKAAVAFLKDIWNIIFGKG